MQNLSQAIFFFFTCELDLKRCEVRITLNQGTPLHMIYEKMKNQYDVNFIAFIIHCHFDN